jgi:hypothetical protein
VVDVFMHDGVASVGAPCAQLAQLVLGVLALIVGANAGVNRNTYINGLSNYDWCRAASLPAPPIRANCCL